MRKFVDEPDLIKEMGKAGRKRVISDFDGEKMTQLWVEYYHDIVPIE
jgi:glycosyltransferase involved in cell wall biosynthesis